MNTFDKNMEKIFDVTPVEEEKKSLVPVTKEPIDSIASDCQRRTTPTSI
jgi:hypothetical protein